VSSVSREWAVDFMRSMGYQDVADEAERTLPDPVDMDELVKFGESHGLNRGELVDRMGGSP
jgi:hypothetical protein